MAILTKRLTESVEIGATKEIAFSTEVVETDGGWEQRNGRWQYPRLNWRCSLPHQLRTGADYLAVVSLHLVAKGRLYGFLFKDWNDHTATDEAFGTGDGVTTVFQLRKNYAIGGGTAQRKITRPVTTTVVIKKAGVTQGSGFTINYDTGVVTFSVAPASGALTWSGEFDVPVRFMDDELSITGATKELVHVAFDLIELKE